MSERARYTGKGLGLVDDKGRVAIPVDLRAALAENAPRPDGKDGGTVIVGPHPKYRCLIAYDPGHRAAIDAEVERLEAEAFARTGERDYSIAARANATETLPFDGSGRFIMPAYERRYARIEGAAFFNGDGKVITIWSPKVLLALEDYDSFVQEACEFWCEKTGFVP